MGAMDQYQQQAPDQNQSQNPPQSALHPMVVLRPGERVICEIKRHPFGILSAYFSGAIAIIAVFTLAIVAPSYLEQSGATNLAGPALLAAIILSIGIVCGLWIATSIYWQNRWIVTDDSVTQIIQDGLFGRRTSQLSMENLEDVTVDQHGIIQSMFNFGTLKAETAGERSKFVFPFCPNPNAYARKILEVHEAFLHQSRHQPQQVNPVMPMSDSPHYQQPQPDPQQYQQQMAQAPYHTEQQLPQQTQPTGQPTAQLPPYEQPQQPHFPSQNPHQHNDQQHSKTPAIWGD